MENENNDIVITDKIKMDELLKLLEELVINKIRIEKIKQGISDNEHKKVLDQEIQIVAKIQEVVKKIQTSEMKVVFKKLLEELKQNSKELDKYTFNGDDAEFDNNMENTIFNLLKAILETHENVKNDEILISAFNNSSSVIIEITNKEKYDVKQKNIYNNEHISLVYTNDDELEVWLKKTSLSNLLNTFQYIKNTSKAISATIEIEIEIEKNILKKTIIMIPYTSSITKAQFVKLSDQTFAIPVEYIDKIININSVKTEKSNGKDFIKYTDRIIPIIVIDKKLDMVIEEDYVSYVILEYNDQMKALPVNSILEQSDIVVRPKPQAISEILEYKGMAILDDGNVTIVIDVPSLIQVNA